MYKNVLFSHVWPRSKSEQWQSAETSEGSWKETLTYYASFVLPDYQHGWAKKKEIAIQSLIPGDVTITVRWFMSALI